MPPELRAEWLALRDASAAEGSSSPKHLRFGERMARVCEDSSYGAREHARSPQTNAASLGPRGYGRDHSDACSRRLGKRKKTRVPCQPDQWSRAEYVEGPSLPHGKGMVDA